MCDRCADTDADTHTQPNGRPKLWTLRREYLCSVVGTCLAPDDIAWLVRRLGLKSAPDATDYDIHRYFVDQAGQQGVGSKLMHKRLDEKFSGAVRRFGRARDEAEWTALWNSAVETGTIAAAYWALLTTPAVPDALRVRAFGQVHMLSHLMGRENRQHLKEKQTLARRCEELEERLARLERGCEDRLAEKDREIAALRDAARRRAASGPAPRPATQRPADAAPRRSARLERSVDALQRRVAAERARARAAEEERDRLSALVGDGAAAQVAAFGPAPGDGSGNDLSGRSILYVGGRTKMMPHLRAAVEARNGCLLHHDGGFEMTGRCLEGMVERADVVVCPIDCVSHDACLKVKGLCRRLRKPFVPVRSAGASTFARLLGTLAIPENGCDRESHL